MNIHPTAEISPNVILGVGCQIWHYTQIREGATIGDQSIIGRDGVFVGPRACLTNDRYPRAITPCGRRKGQNDWTQGAIHVGYGASIGAGAIIVTDVTIGAFAMIGAGAVVTANVPAHGLALGTPARLVGYVCKCGYRLEAHGPLASCEVCGWSLPTVDAFYARLQIA
jgi:acetyltransferase-like isoleucine patch superfamily enzyme